MNLLLRAFNEMFPDEDAARAWFEKARWPNGPKCCHCGAIGNALYMPKTRFWHCKAC
ncbi:transposase, partial [Acidocella sp.]|uniref:transposase n=1 Tax=Acidocella sp. TaxID=50710 RepID=UPI003459BABE